MPRFCLESQDLCMYILCLESHELCTVYSLFRIKGFTYIFCLESRYFYILCVESRDLCIFFV